MKSDEQQTLDLITAMISRLPTTDQIAVMACAGALLSVIRESGAHGMAALAFLGASAASGVDLLSESATETLQ